MGKGRGGARLDKCGRATRLAAPLQVSGRAFMPIEVTEQYKKSKMAPVMETRGSKFCKFQEARLQEMADEVRGGARCVMPRWGEDEVEGARVEDKVGEEEPYRCGS